MTVIPEDIVESACREIGNLPKSEIGRRVAEIGETQPVLLAFLRAGSKSLGREAQNRAVYMFVVVLCMFEKHCAELNTVGIESLERVRDRIEVSQLALSAADEAALELAALANSKNQPFVMKYLAEALVGRDPDTDCYLTIDEVGKLSIIMTTVVNALQEKCRTSYL
jgi:hypothetical protein